MGYNCSGVRLSYIFMFRIVVWAWSCIYIKKTSFHCKHVDLSYKNWVSFGKIFALKFLHELGDLLSLVRFVVSKSKIFVFFFIFQTCFLFVYVEDFKVYWSFYQLSKGVNSIHCKFIIAILLLGELEWRVNDLILIW